MLLFIALCMTSLQPTKFGNGLKKSQRCLDFRKIAENEGMHRDAIAGQEASKKPEFEMGGSKHANEEKTGAGKMSKNCSDK